MKETYSYSDLKDMAEFAAANNHSMVFRIEIIKEICEMVGLDWSKFDIKVLKYYAEEPEQLPRDPWMFKRAIRWDARC